jgi:post-segregation antitoxin (ccd killing protein)
MGADRKPPPAPHKDQAAREAQWLAENRQAIEERNAWVAEHGMPLADLRRF